MNKTDLIPAELVVAWRTYFQTRFPNLHIITFTSVPKSRKNTKQLENEAKLKRQIYAIHSHHKLYECVRDVTKDSVNLDSWNELINKHLKKVENNEEFITNETVQKHAINEETASQSTHKYVTIGCCGFPNVGKSSLLNTLVGRKVVSVSKTPGHTKHLQTIFLTPNVRLCDCPGLVFPSLVAKPLQILSGIYPIAQLQEPYSVIRYLGEHTRITDTLNIQHPDGQEQTGWTPLDICEAWALKRRYFTAKAARPDVYRAANEVLRMALDGRLFIYLRPKHFQAEREKWLQHPETLELKQALESFGFKNEYERKVEIELEEEEDDDDEEQYDGDEDTEGVVGDLEENKNSSDTENASDEDDSTLNRYNILSKFEDN